MVNIIAMTSADADPQCRGSVLRMAKIKGNHTQAVSVVSPGWIQIPPVSSSICLTNSILPRDLLNAEPKWFACSRIIMAGYQATHVRNNSALKEDTGRQNQRQQAHRNNV